MKVKGENTKQKIMDSAQKIILKKGFSGTSLDEIIDDAGLTKGGFFYHFKGRSELAKSLLIRFLEEDTRLIQELIDKARRYADDPYQQLLIFLKLYAELVEQMEETHPGCLIATYTYESQQFDPEILQLMRDGVETWRQLYFSVLEPAAKSRGIRHPFTTEKLADLLNAVIEGGILLTKVKGNNDILVQQMLEYREVVKIAFTPQ